MVHSSGSSLLKCVLFYLLNWILLKTLVAAVITLLAVDVSFPVKQSLRWFLVRVPESHIYINVVSLVWIF